MGDLISRIRAYIKNGGGSHSSRPLLLLGFLFRFLLDLSRWHKLADGALAHAERGRNDVGLHPRCKQLKHKEPLNGVELLNDGIDGFGHGAFPPTSLWERSS